MSGYSQYGQHDWLVQQFPVAFKGYAVDVGANDGRFFSNTLGLEELGWLVLCIEANSDYEAMLRQNRKLVRMCAASDSDTEESTFYINPGSPQSESSLRPLGGMAAMTPRTVKTRTLERLLDEVGFSKLDVLSIDCEHTESDVLRGINLGRWKPRCIIVEDQQGPIGKTEELKPFGYRFVQTFESDHLFLRDP